MSGSIQRIWALVMRHIYIWRSSVMRLVDSIYWPAVQMVMWGFMTEYLLPQASFMAQAAGVLLSGLLGVSQVGRGERWVLRPGDYFGEVALAMDVPRTASVRAVTPAVIASCDRETFDELVRPLFADDVKG